MEGASSATSATCSAHALDSMLTDEVMASYKEHLRREAQKACYEIDRLLCSALRQLPPHVRALPVREAFKIGCEPPCKKTRQE
mmetsp:Transcript_1265/g.2201  ORF Transcript_1265/g.2201 Transcript_1265/m.2201 type:complete len:83 (-) Transcript_1265:252-500(-)|eukprot:CAMPEP_0169113740 /NCGR_PEP_ID=MMETSP1015-20121227/28373_1 /TAXON_ID=342587 /ORGANISM="Karlodinium micrum, Strain CCMP2283" /LENGTH=82 /DNA_ID=CAMNT_0009175951 /DNA_START=57 /DNA_END=305 /DNA_ORIENTATION=+